MKRNGQAALSISLPESLRKVVERRVRRSGFGNLSEYIRTLIRADADTPSDPSPAPNSPTVDFGAEHWRELREALLLGEVVVMRRRLAEAAELFRAALVMRCAMLKKERPRAARATLAAALASWLREQGAESEDPALRPAPERLAKFQRG